MGRSWSAMQAQEWQLARRFMVANHTIPDLVSSERDKAFFGRHVRIHRPITACVNSTQPLRASALPRKCQHHVIKSSVRNFPGGVFISVKASLVHVGQST